MSLPPQMREEAPAIDSYGGGGFRFGSGWVSGSVLLLPSGLAPWSVQSIKEAKPEDFSAVFEVASDVDFVLIGCGAEISALPKDIRAAFEARKLPVDIMQTGAACRTYNVVMAEGRRLAAALIATD